MCGIYGMVNFDGARVATQALNGTGVTTIHRGPDDEETRINGACLVGHVPLEASISADEKAKGGELNCLRTEPIANLSSRAIHRQKHGFGTPTGAGLKRDLSSMIRSLLSKGTVTARDSIRPQVVEKVGAEHDSHRIISTGPSPLINLEIWCRAYLNGRDAHDVASALPAAR